MSATTVADIAPEGAGLVSPDQVREAARRLAGVAVRTPLLPAPWLAEAVGADVRLKCENLQRSGAFKMRGAYNTIASLAPEERRRGVITYSSGNHGQALALSAKLFGIPAVVVMPTTAPKVKVEGARAYGAEVVFAGTTSTERYNRAVEIVNERGLTMIPPFDDPRIIAGQGTVGLEILEDFPEVETILVQVGGGGLLSGIAAYVKREKPSCSIVGVEPEVSCAMRRSKLAGHPVTIEARQSIADGLLPVRPGDLTFAHARALVDDVVVVAEEAIAHAAGRVLTLSKLVVEPSGAATVAALLSGAFRPTGPTVAVLSGGNVDPARLPELAAS
ncbi:MAG TPA: threonine/serine dehydratase [Longimicrobiales bacterium]|nr:threonine/serine dehydratase [Longimicrobiales bacterium]